MHLLSVLVSFTLAVHMLTQCNLNCSLSVICMCLCQHWHFYFIAMVTAFIFVWQGKLGHYTSGIAGATTGPLNWAAILPCQTSAFLFFFFSIICSILLFTKSAIHACVLSLVWVMTFGQYCALLGGPFMACSCHCSSPNFCKHSGLTTLDVTWNSRICYTGKKFPLIGDFRVNPRQLVSKPDAFPNFG